MVTFCDLCSACVEGARFKSHRSCLLFFNIMADNPSQRITRSGSNSASITLNDIKTLLDSSRTEILKDVKTEIGKYCELLQLSLLKRLDEMMEKNEELNSRVKELEGRVEKLSKGCSNEGERSFGEDVCRESEERHKRRKFVIISGLREPPSGSPEERLQEDRKSVRALALRIGVESLEVMECSRIGPLTSQRPRLLRAKLSSFKMKSDLLRAAKNLRRHKDYQKVFINPDLTRIQRETDKALRMELKTRRGAGESVVIRGGRIVNGMSRDNQNSLGEQNFV